MTMLRKTLILTMAPVLLALALAPAAHSWGGYHVGYTHYGPYTGFQHVGYTGYRSPYGGYRYGGYGGYGGYHYGYRYGGYGGGYRYGYYRRW
jgi:hypothetical protein